MSVYFFILTLAIMLRWGETKPLNARLSFSHTHIHIYIYTQRFSYRSNGSIRVGCSFPFRQGLGGGRMCVCGGCLGSTSLTQACTNEWLGTC